MKAKAKSPVLGAAAVESVEMGTGNVFADLGLSDPDDRHLRVQLATRLIDLLELEGLTQAAAAKRLGISRSQLYATAMAEYVAKFQASKVSERLDAVYAREASPVHPKVARAQLRTLKSTEWWYSGGKSGGLSWRSRGGQSPAIGVPSRRPGRGLQPEPHSNHSGGRPDFQPSAGRGTRQCAGAQARIGLAQGLGGQRLSSDNYRSRYAGRAGRRADGSVMGDVENGLRLVLDL